VRIPNWVAGILLISVLGIGGHFYNSNTSRVTRLEARVTRIETDLNSGLSGLDAKVSILLKHAQLGAHAAHHGNSSSETDLADSESVSLVPEAAEEPGADGQLGVPSPTLDVQCNRGNGGACYTLAARAERSHRADFLERYEVACRARNGPSCFRLAWHLHQQPSPDLARARSLYEQGCSLNSGPSCYNLALLDRNGIDTEEIVHLFEKACERNVASACGALGAALLRRGGSVNITKARSVLTSACDDGNMDGCANLAHLLVRYENGFARALQLYSRACTEGLAWACFDKGQLERLGRGNANAADADASFRRSCELGFSRACGHGQQP